MKRLAIPLTLSLVTLGAAAQAQAPVALVEEITGKPAGIEFMDYVAPGKVVALGPRDGVVLGYIRSCWRESIRGGTVRVGQDQSEVSGGSVERVKIACDGGRMELAAEQAKQSATSVIRDPKVDRPKRATLPRPQFVLYGLSPVVELKGGGALLLERLDVAGDTRTIELAPATLLHGAFADLADLGIALSPGGLYLARATEQELVFRIDGAAVAGKTPLAGRLLRFRPPG
jgi:hypothetical protein